MARRRRKTTRKSLAKCSPEELIRIYAEAAVVHGRARVSPANAAADRIHAVYSELRRRGKEHQRQLLSLLSHDDNNVRLWAAAHALEFEPERGEQVLRRLSQLPGLKVGFSAQMTLEAWRKGELRFP